MQEDLKRYLLISLGWLSVILGAIGALLPVIPTTPFLILALACFSKSSPRFHKMLVDNKWFGPALTQWEQNKTISRHIKFRAMALVIVSFGGSIAILWGRNGLQLMLVAIGLIALWFIYQLKESEPPIK
ncbi:MAG: YbaN family protein [Piscirickettsiaceae bacterium]|jgi:uncharacterized protein|nr:YbaN family protein [Piscirickettsiaceae bacterium]